MQSESDLNLRIPETVFVRFAQSCSVILVAMHRCNFGNLNMSTASLVQSQFRFFQSEVEKPLHVVYINTSS